MLLIASASLAVGCYRADEPEINRASDYQAWLLDRSDAAIREAAKEVLSGEKSDSMTRQMVRTWELATRDTTIFNPVRTALLYTAGDLGDVLEFDTITFFAFAAEHDPQRLLCGAVVWTDSACGLIDFRGDAAVRPATPEVCDAARVIWAGDSRKDVSGNLLGTPSGAVIQVRGQEVTAALLGEMSYESWYPLRNNVDSNWARRQREGSR